VNSGNSYGHDDSPATEIGAQSLQIQLTTPTEMFNDLTKVYKLRASPCCSSAVSQICATGLCAGCLQCFDTVGWAAGKKMGDGGGGHWLVWMEWHPAGLSSAHLHHPLHPFNGLFSRTTSVSRHQKGKPLWILLEQKMMGWQRHQLDHTQIICTSLQTDNHASTSPLKFFVQARCPSCRPTNSVKELKANTHSLLRKQQFVPQECEAVHTSIR